MEINKIYELKELTELADKASREYYSNNNSIMSDKEFDDLFDKIKKLELETGMRFSGSPTQKVGYEVVSNLNKVKHNHPMLSLDKTKSIEELLRFQNDKDSVLMCKIDGLTISLRYVKGELVSAETRGDGEIGEDVLHTANVFKNIPLKINTDIEEIVIDGDAIITYEDFNRINEELSEDKKYKNPRNLASGSVRQLDNSIAKERNLQFIAWKFVKGSKSNSFFDRLFELERLGFTATPRIFLTSHETLGELESDINFLKRVAEDKEYPIDGMVLGYDDVEYGESLGATEHHLKSQIAYKFYDEEEETELIDIEWTMGKSGVLTPVGIFKSVEIDGTSVSRASLHNISVMRDTLGIPYYGQKIWVTKRNMIIPCIERGEIKSKENINLEDLLLIPDHCPYCDSDTDIKIDAKSKVEILYCTNPKCSGMIVGKISNAVGNDALDINGLSEATIDKFHELGYLNSLKDLYHLKEHKKELMNLEGFGRTSVEKLLASIEKSRKTSLRRFLCALNIPLIGRKQSRILEKEIYRLYDATEKNVSVVEFFVDLVIDNSWFFWKELDEFGEKKAKSIKNYVMDNFQIILDFAKEFEFEYPLQEFMNAPVDGEKDLTGLTFVITGDVHIFKNRKEIEEEITSKGGKVSGTVSKKTSYLMCNEMSLSNKCQKALELKIPIINEEQLIGIIR